MFLQVGILRGPDVGVLDFPGPCRRSLTGITLFLLVGILIFIVLSLAAGDFLIFGANDETNK